MLLPSLTYTSLPGGDTIQRLGRRSSADKAFHSWITKYDFYALGVEPLILQRGSRPLTLGHNALIRIKSYSQRWMAETSYSTMNRSLGDAARALSWYRQFRKIVLMFAVSNIEPLCEPL
jgi:IS5 family transposase